jgi:rhodanese-related sulfurtransferase
MTIDKKRLFKNELYGQFGRVAKALSHPSRIELIDLLAQSERTVEDLARETTLSIANASQHLQVLRAAQLVDVRRQGPYKFYRIADSKVFEIWRAIRAFGEAHLAEIDRVVNTYLAERSKLTPVSATELSDLLDEGTAVVIDVRPQNEYDTAHLKGAVSIPIAELKRRLTELPRRKEIVAYCRGPYCVYADEAVAQLTARGYKARRLDIGLPDWKALGLPVESAVS